MSERLTSDAAWDDVQGTARSWNFDSYIAATLAPRAAQSNLIAIAAFVGELERIIATVSEPTLAQIRIQWWRDELKRLSDHGFEADRADHPLADALSATIARHNLPLGLVLGVADAAMDQISEPQLVDDFALHGWINKRHAAPIELMHRCLENPAGVRSDAIVAAGRCYGLSRLIANALASSDVLERLGIVCSQDDLRRAALAAYRQAKSLMPANSRVHRVAYIPVSLVPLYLDAGGREPSRLRKMTRMAGAHLLARY